MAPLFVLELVFQRRHGRVRLYQPDPVLGWATKPNFRMDVVNRDAGGAVYRGVLATESHGFREWGDPDSRRPRVLFVGDSITADAYVGNDDAYFAHARERLDAEVFAAGGGGFGTLQEALLVERHAPAIRPDVLVLQFCPNDFHNNSLALEDDFVAYSQRNLRPYLVRGQVVFRYPPWHPWRFAYHSALLNHIADKIQLIRYRQLNGYFPPRDRAGELRWTRDIAMAGEITGTLLVRMARAVAPWRTRLLTFNSTGTRHRHQSELWRQYAVRAGFTVLPQVADAVERAEDEGQVVRAADGNHWNAAGHRIAGKALAEALRPVVAAVRRARRAQRGGPSRTP